MSCPVASSPGVARAGKVWLIGAGPGDPELLTLKAVRALGAADVVLLDALVDRTVLAHVKPGARIIEAGKRGVTAGIGVPAALGIPVTHRALSHGVTLVTGHTREGSGPNWRALAASRTTLVIYMGLSRLDAITVALCAAGMAGTTPAAAIQSGTLATQRHVVATLCTLAKAVAGTGLSSPAILVVGEVVRLAVQDAHTFDLIALQAA